MSDVLRRSAKYISAIGVGRGLGLSLHRYLSKLLNPRVTFAWGSLGEDVLIWWYLTEVLGIREPGYYVDVGCNDPINHSNTWRLYQLGWKGLCIDADETVTERFKKIRPRDKVACELASDADAVLDFHVFEGSLVSSVVREHIDEWRKVGKIIEVRQLRAKTLDKIFDEHGVPKSFAVLKIDVEGHDAAALRSVDLQNYHPRIILIEIHGETVETIRDNEIYIRLVSCGYSMVSLAGYNGIFIRRESTK
jgi:FkbM family methyltransferase